MNPETIAKRLQALRQKMQQAGVEALFFNDPSNVTYLSGFTNVDSFLLITGDDFGAANYFLTDSRYTEQANRECTLYQIIDYRDKNPSHSLAGTVAQFCKDHKISCLGFEAQQMTYAVYQSFAQAAGDSFRLEPAPGLVQELRLVKSPEEQELLRQACAATDRVFLNMLEQLHSGMTEKEAEWLLTTLIHQEGCQHSFPPIVVSGSNGAMPHGVATDKIIQKGEFLTMDFGCIYQGYHADMTRTVAFGSIDSKLREIYDTVLQANTQAEQAIKAGVPCCQVDKIARDIIKEAGYGDYFGHGLGHGVGLDIHEQPFMGPNNQAILQEYSFVTVEPGIYIPGLAGVRIEDTVMVTASGIEQLYTSTKDLICLP